MDGVHLHIIVLKIHQILFHAHGINFQLAHHTNVTVVLVVMTLTYHVIMIENVVFRQRFDFLFFKC